MKYCYTGLHGDICYFFGLFIKFDRKRNVAIQDQNVLQIRDSEMI